MKPLLPLLIAAICLPLDAWSEGQCLSSSQAQIPKVADLQIPNSNLSVGVCHLPELPPKAGVFAAYNRDLIVLKEGGKQVASQPTRSSITVGRMSELVLEKNTEKFVAVSYDAGEFCNGIVIFNKEKRRSAAFLGCVSDSDICHIAEIDDLACKAKVECKDQGAEGKSPTRQQPIIKSLSLCKK